MMLMAPEPILSVVLTAQNDDVDVVRRTQLSVSALIQQCAEYGLAAELVVVEWNPPIRRPRLREALVMPRDSGKCIVRIISVPNHIHGQQQHSDTLAQFPMMARNVGIRRAQAPAILCINPGVLLSRELVVFLASEAAERGVCYRIDRHDVAAAIPAAAPIDQQLAFCQSHLLRLHAREGTFWNDADGRRGRFGTLESQDLAPPGAGIHFGDGWHAPESSRWSRYRWGQSGCVLFVRAGASPVVGVNFAIEAGPGLAYGPFKLEVRDCRGGLAARAHVAGGSSLCLQLPVTPGRENRFSLHAPSCGLRSGGDDRCLDFRIFQPVSIGRPPAAPSWRQMTHRIRSLARRGLRTVRRWRTASMPPLQPHTALEPMTRTDAPTAPNEDPSIQELHLRTCDDFIFMTRSDWHALRGFPELAIQPTRLAALFCCMARALGVRQEILQAPLRLYHVEHEHGCAPAPLQPGSDAAAVPTMTNAQLLAFVHQSHFAPTLLNRTNWGLGDESLEEVTLTADAPRDLGVCSLT